MRVSLPSPPKRLAAGSAPLLSSRVIVSFPPRPNPWISAVLAIVAVPPTMATAPPLIRILPAALRLTVIVLSRLSAITVSTPLAGAKDAVTAIVLFLFELPHKRGGRKALVWVGGARFKRDCAAYRRRWRNF